MASGRRLERLLAQVIAGRGSIQFREFEALIVALGFEFKRQTGSHRQYLHPKVGRPFPIQPDGNEAKRYQCRELRDMISAYGLTLDPDK